MEDFIYITIRILRVWDKEQIKVQIPEVFNLNNLVFNARKHKSKQTNPEWVQC